MIIIRPTIDKNINILNNKDSEHNVAINNIQIKKIK